MGRVGVCMLLWRSQMEYNLVVTQKETQVLTRTRSSFHTTTRLCCMFYPCNPSYVRLLAPSVSQKIGFVWLFDRLYCLLWIKKSRAKEPDRLDVMNYFKKKMFFFLENKKQRASVDTMRKTSVESSYHEECDLKHYLPIHCSIYLSARMPAKRNLQQIVLKAGSCFCSRTLISQAHEDAKPGMLMRQPARATMQAMLGRQNQKRKCLLGTKPETEKDRAQSR
jgi:hypothetical protein